MIDKIKAEADAIPCGKDEKIKALEALLKLALKERDEALAYAERLRGAFEYALKDGLTEQAIKMILAETPPAALASLKAEWQVEALEAINGFVWVMPSGSRVAYADDIEDMISNLKRAQEAGDE